MNAISKTLVAVSAIAALGAGAYYGTKQASLSLAADFNKTYQQVFVQLPPLIKPDSAQAWADATRKALEEADQGSLSRGIKLLFAAPGTRGVLNDINAEIAKMMDLRRDQLASVEKRLADDRSGIEEPWIAQLPSELQGQVKDATRTIAWLKADAGRNAELKPLAEDFEAKVARLRQKVGGAGSTSAQPAATTEGGDAKAVPSAPKISTPSVGETPTRTSQAASPVQAAYFSR